MYTYKAVISYDGSVFFGFASQKSNVNVTDYLKNALARVGITTDILGASRTDKGVHATRQVICFGSSYIHTYKKAFLISLLNEKLHPHIMIRSLHRVGKSFHPRFDAKWRAYRFLLTSELPSPFMSAYVTRAKIGDKRLFESALNIFKGEHNFSLFKKNGSYTKNHIRTIFDIKYYQYRNIDVVYMRGDGFLRSQVRLMVGAALSVSNGNMSLQDLQEQLLTHKRYYSYPLSPNGLYLCGVGYS